MRLRTSKNKDMLKIAATANQDLAVSMCECVS